MSLPRHSIYKDSGTPWLGLVPKHWRVSQLRRVIARMEQGWSPECDSRPADADEWGVLKSGCVNGGQFNPLENKALPFCHAVPSELEIACGDLLMSRASGSPRLVGAVALVRDTPPKLLLSDKTFRLHVTDHVRKDFLAWCLTSYALRAQIECAISGAAGLANNLPQSSVIEFFATFPPLSEQRQISEYLELETDRIDALVEDQRRLIELLKEKRQVVISRAVTKGLNPKVPMKDSQVDWLGKVPTHWDVSRLRYVARPGTSITYGIVQAGPHIEDGIPYIKTSDMSGSALPLDGYSKTTAEIDASYARSRVAAGDLVISIRASVGKCLPVPAQLDGANLTQGTAKIAPGDTVDAGFLLAYINALPVQTYLNSVSKGATFKEITLDALRKTPVLLPPLSEQRLIASHVQAVNEQYQELIDGAEAAEALLLERRVALVSAAVTGKIDVRNFQA